MLLTCGCSFVWGDELDGCYDDPPSHWPLTFTHQLAEKLGVPYKNIAQCGNGNDKIFRDVVDYLTHPENPKVTHMVILWSAWQRTEIAEPEIPNRYRNIGRFDNMTQFSPERINNTLCHKWGGLYKYYNESYDVRTSILQHLTLMVAMQELADLKGIKLIQGAFHHRMMDNIANIIMDKEQDFHQWSKKFARLMGKLRKECRVGLGHYETMREISTRLGDIKPHSHPGEQSHAEYAVLLDHIFKKLESTQ